MSEIKRAIKDAQSEDDAFYDSLAGEQPLSDDERALVDLAYSRLTYFELKNRPYHSEAKGAREVYRLRDPMQDAAIEDSPEYIVDEDTGEETVLNGNQNRDKRTLQLQTLKSTINQCVADQMLSIPQAKLLPETPQQQNVADALQDALHHIIYEVNRYTRLYRRRVEDFYITGSCLIETGWDENASAGKGDVAIARWPIEAFCWDPGAEDLQDARALIKVSWHPLSWYKARYPETGKYVQGEDASMSDIGLPLTQIENSQDDEGRAMLLEYWYRTYSNGRYHINVAHIAGHALLQTKENVYDHGMYPFVLDTNFTIEGQPVGDGLVGTLIPMMRYINRYTKYLDTNLRLSSKARILARRDAKIDLDALMNYDVDMIEADSIQRGADYDFLENPPLNMMIVNQLRGMQAEMKEDSGANQATRGEPSASVTSGKMQQLLMQAGSKVGQMNSVFLNDGFSEMTWQVLCIIMQKYNNSRLNAITGRKDIFDFFDGDINLLQYTVQVEVQQKDPQRIQAQNQMFVDMYTMAAQAQQYFPVSALIQLMNIDGKDKILPVIQEMEAKADQLKQLGQQNTQLIEQLTQMQKENDSLRQIESQAIASLGTMGRSPQVNQGRQVAATRQP